MGPATIPTPSVATSTDYCGGRSCGDDIARALQLVSGRWGVPVLEALVFAGTALRFRELQRRVGVISQKELSRHLAAFVAARVVTRHQDALHATRVHYALSERGRALLQQMDALGQWAQAPWRESAAVTRPSDARSAAASAATWLGPLRD